MASLLPSKDDVRFQSVFPELRRESGNKLVASGGKTLSGLVKSIHDLRSKTNSEYSFIRRTLRKYAGSHSKLLDVGCGYSRFYSLIRSQAYEYVGIDSNPKTVEHNRGLGRNVILPEDIASLDGHFDVVLFSHVIEHLDYPSLISFFDQYLGKLRSGGIAIILTPLYHRGFYDDFDHVKPYNPGALRQLLCGSTKQLQPISIRGAYKETDLWLKRDPFWHSYHKSKLDHLGALAFAVVSIISFGCIGKLTGYGMVLTRTS